MSVSAVCIYMVSGLTTFHWISNKEVRPWKRLILALLLVISCSIILSRGGWDPSKLSTFCVNMFVDDSLVSVSFWQLFLRATVSQTSLYSGSDLASFSLFPKPGIQGL